MRAIFDDSLITGNKTIDGHHQELIDKINNLITCCEAGSGKEEAKKMLDYLADYTEFHFSAEEKLQEEVGYPGLAEHKVKHEEFKKTVAMLYEMLEKEGPTDVFTEAVNEKVTEWLYGHIKGFDCSVATYMNISNIAELI